MGEYGNMGYGKKLTGLGTGGDNDGWCSYRVYANEPSANTFTIIKRKIRVRRMRLLLKPDYTVFMWWGDERR